MKQKCIPSKMTNAYSGRTKFGDVEFTDDQIDEYRVVFTEFDIDGDGTVTTQVSNVVIENNFPHSSCRDCKYWVSMVTL